MSKKHFDCKVSYFKNVADVSNPVTVNLLTFLSSEKHRENVLKIRAIPDKETRDRLKVQLLPGITPSGVFSHRSEAHLIQHSGLLAGDIDFKDNPYTPESIKDFVCGFHQVAYCALSASGQGIWFLVPIEQPNHHKEHFAALHSKFASEGIQLDKAPANVASFRFYSYDPNAYYNPDAVPFGLLQAVQLDIKPTIYKAPISSDDAAKVESILQQIEAHRMDITDGYDNWAKFGFSFAAAFGEQGRDYFHRLSQYHPKYSTGKTDDQYTKCLRYKSNRLTLDYFLGHAKRNGLFFAKPGQAATTPIKPVAYHNGIALNEYGYPAMWDT
jgi:VirE N-terminal domain/Primase C terminal 2 (PriCT-2)